MTCLLTVPKIYVKLPRLERIGKNRLFVGLSPRIPFSFSFSWFLDVSSRTRQSRRRVPRLMSDNFTCFHTRERAGRPNHLSQPVTLSGHRPNQYELVARCGDRTHSWPGVARFTDWATPPLPTHTSLKNDNDDNDNALSHWLASWGQIILRVESMVTKRSTILKSSTIQCICERYHKTIKQQPNQTETNKSHR